MKNWRNGAFLGILLAVVMAFCMIPMGNVCADGDPIQFRVDGDAGESVDDRAAMIMVSMDGGDSYTTLRELAGRTDGKVTKGENNTYIFDRSIASVKAYVSYDAGQYMVQSAIGSDAQHAVTITAGMQMIQIDKIRYTVTWAYDDKRYGADAWLEHGTAQIIDVDGTTDFTDWDFYGNNPGNEDGGNLVVTPGQTVTVRLVPEYGYQLQSISLNGNTLVPQEQISTFSFVMPRTNVHFKGAFVKTEDVVTNQADTVRTASVANGSNAVTSGSLQLEVSQGNAEETKIADAKNMVEGATEVEAVNLSLNQIISKGNGENWSTNLTQLAGPVQIRLALKDYDDAYDYTVVRNHEGTLTKLDTVISDGALTFETDQFSTYMIVKKSKASGQENAKTENKTNADADKNTNNDPTGTQSPNGEAAPKTTADLTSTATNQILTTKAAALGTGDSSPVVIWLAIAGACMIIINGMTVLKRKRL